MKTFVFVFVLVVSPTLSIILGGDGGGGGFHGGGHSGGRSSSSSSSSGSGSSEEHGHGGHRPPHRPPHRPRPTVPPRSECDNGWLRFERDGGSIWCIYIGYSGVTNGWFSQSDAQIACTALGATLTGFQNDNERMTVATIALTNVTARGGQVAGLWLGATNLPGCRSPSCGPFNTFQWTDGHTTGVGGLKWGVGEPDGNNWPGPTACIQQFIISPNFVAGANEFGGWKGAFVNGDLDKYACVSQAYPFTRMYACGKVGVKR